MNIEDYQAGLAYLKSVNSAHRFLDLIIRGYTPINCKYLEIALNELPKPVRDKDNYSKQDPRLDDLHKQLSKLFSKRAKLSNRFHVLSDNVARAKNSDRIQEVQRVISRTLKQVDYFAANGELPLKPSNPKYHVPEDPLEAYKKLRSLEAGMSRAKRELKSMSGNPENKAKISQKEKYLSEKQKHHAYIRQALEKAGIY